MRKTIYKSEISHMEIEPYEGFIFLHFTTSKWSKTIYKECLELLAELLNILKEKGISEICVAVPLPDKKLYKFALLFGFYPLVLCEESGLFIMNQEI